MAGVLGEPLNEGVVAQINKRQEALGIYSGIPDPVIKTYYGRTAFLRLASSVNINESDEDAKNYILFGGISTLKDAPTSAENDTTRLKVGLASYKVKNGERGLIPMPGLISANVGYYNRGALAKADIKIRVYSRDQLEIIDKLYCRPGYTILLEWGWTRYLKNGGGYSLESIDANINGPLDALFTDGTDQYQIISKIKATRRLTNYNYDGLYGKVSKFSWSFNPDGSYDITINAIGLGDVIESLKINISPPNTTEGEKEEGQPLIISNKDKSALNGILWQIYDTNKNADKTFNDFTDALIFTVDPETGETQSESGQTISEAIYSIQNPSFKTTEKSTPQVYIKFGLLCNLLQSYSMFKDEKGKHYINLDFNFKNLNEDTSYCLAFPGEFSADPTVCLVPPSQNQITQNTYINSSDIDANFIAKATPSVYTFGLSAIRTANIYINLDFIVATMNSLSTQNEKDSSITYLDFLKAILNGVAKALGGFNQFEVYTDEVTNSIIIRDNNPINDPSIKYKKTGIFKAYGVAKNLGSFLTKINLSAELSNNFATIVAIGAQVEGNQPTANATGLASWNNGLIDRIIKEKISGNLEQPEKTEDTPEVRLKKIDKKIQDTIKSLPDRDTIDSLVSFNNEYASLSLGFYQKTGITPAPGLFPLNLSLEMDGLSGMVNYQKFEITDEVLPPQYKENIDFIIKGITHNIADSRWITSIDSIMSPKIKEASAADKNASTAEQRQNYAQANDTGE